jgi:diguanylate cyclase (GGDEF)-like protein
MKTLLKFLDKMSFAAICVLTVLMTLIIGVVDFIIGHEISTALFYVLPIAVAAWYGGRKLGIAVSVLAAAAWLITDIGAGQQYSHPAILPWNTFMRLAIFLLIALLLAAFRGLLHAEALAAKTDHLTGALNRLGFQERFAEEYARSARFGRAFSLAYLDIDNFKHINDTRGHGTGDEALMSVARTLKENLRRTDVVARLGGDEFAVLFPETGTAAVREAFAHVHQRLLQAMQNRDWPLSFSIGVVSFESVPESLDQALAATDELMYSIKRSTKNNVIYQTWDQTRQPGLADSA